MRTPSHAIVLLAVLAPLCLRAGASDAPRFSGERMIQDVRVLSSDPFEGRAPATAGEDSSIAYLVGQLNLAGLEPGNPDGTYLQDVTLVGVTSQPKAVFHLGGSTLEAMSVTDMALGTRRTNASLISVKGSDLIFAGYGVVAPEYNWDDFKDVDVRGKTIIVLVNDPPVPDPADPTRLDPNVFKGKAMTYYGRWSYKYEEASAKGAAGCLVVHEQGPAGYPWGVVASSWIRENFDLASPTGNAERVAAEGWITRDFAGRLFAAAGLDFAKLKAAAVRRDFRPVALGGTADFEIATKVRTVASHNVVARLAGSDPKRRNEYVIYTAHWDHLGRNPHLKGDQIFHGARDNASGCAEILEVARGYAALPPAARPPRSLLFLFVTAEEQGLLGSRYYAEHPLYPLSHTLADINMDSATIFGRTTDIQSVGFGASTLDDIASEIARSQGRTIGPEQRPEWGTYYRSDHFEFAKVGVPACHIKNGWRFEGHDEDYGIQLEDNYTLNDYHKVTDVVRANWRTDGMVQEVETLYELGRRVATDPGWPEWKPGSEFKARRDAMLR
jgi:Zn-dependent M28 family amino/carboxypeptidase